MNSHFGTLVSVHLKMRHSYKPQGHDTLKERLTQRKLWTKWLPKPPQRARRNSVWFVFNGSIRRVTLTAMREFTPGRNRSRVQCVQNALIGNLCYVTTWWLYIIISRKWKVQYSHTATEFWLQNVRLIVKSPLKMLICKWDGIVFYELALKFKGSVFSWKVFLACNWGTLLGIA